MAKIRVRSYCYTTRLVHGEPALPTGTRVFVQQRRGNRLVIEPAFDREDWSNIQRLYWVDHDALTYEEPTR